LTNVPGASTVFLGGAVAYANSVKAQVLRVPEAILTEQGAVSEPVVLHMAEGVRGLTGADHAIAVTGIAGPGGGSPAKPVGTVYIGLAMPGQTIVVHRWNNFDRTAFKEVTSQQALDLLRRCLLGLPLE
jgi:nicotinamide-nucleotide amidase